MQTELSVEEVLQNWTLKVGWYCDILCVSCLLLNVEPLYTKASSDDSRKYLDNEG